MDFFNNSSDLKQWQQTADYLNDVLRDTAGEQLSPAAQEKMRTAASRISSNKWSSHRLVYTLSRLDTKGLIAACTGRHLDWQTALNAKACFGPTEDLQKIYLTARKQGVSLQLNDALNWSSRAIVFCPDLQTSGSLETTGELFKLGADPAYDSGRYFSRAVEDCGIEMGRLFARTGLSGSIIPAQMQNAQAYNKPLLYKDLRELYWEYGRYTAADHETLVEKKNIDDANNPTLKVIFNFATQRVSEIYEFSNKAFPPVLHEFNFENYGQAAIESARKKLTELGGNPSPDTGILPGKKISIRPLGPDQAKS
ncbi:MAG: hypothetical protein K8R48_00205 [Alphaproteobacteria bacterium]|nr:hypothetical protein [Alphaproteobacteria bacterium]